MDEPGPPEVSKSFTISQKFENLFNGDGLQTGEGREHFDILWRLRMLPQYPETSIDLDCFVDESYLKWNIQMEIEWKLSTQNEDEKSIEISEYSISSMKRSKNPTILINSKSLFDDSITVIAHVKILKIDGFGRKRFRKFDEDSMKNLSDVVLIVEEYRFWVSKLFLASQAPFFKTILHLEDSESSTSSESQIQNPKIPEYELEDVDANDFQVFLEVLYGEISIDDENVISLLNLAEKYGAGTVTKKCEHFLLSEESELDSLKHLELAMKYNLEILKAKRQSDVSTAVLFEKVMTFF